MESNLHAILTPVADSKLVDNRARPFHILESVKPLQKPNNDVRCFYKGELLCMALVPRLIIKHQ